MYNVYELRDKPVHIEVWVLKRKEWVMYCVLDIKTFIKVIGCWNKDGDLLIRAVEVKRKSLLVYNLKSEILREARIIGLKDQSKSEIRMYQSSLSSINGFKPLQMLMG